MQEDRERRRRERASPGWRLGGTLGIGRKRARSSEGAKEPSRRGAKKTALYSGHDDVPDFLPLLQSVRVNIATQGSAKPPPWVCVGLRKNFLVGGFFC